jgi:hypothetical protein
MSAKRTPRSVKKSCDKLWAKVVKARAGWRCERCGVSPESARGFQAHHLDGRNNHRLRFDLRNGIASCAACHRWAHDHPLSFAKWFNSYRPEDDAWVTDPAQKKEIHRNLQDYLALEEELRLLLKHEEVPE